MEPPRKDGNILNRVKDIRDSKILVLGHPE